MPVVEADRQRVVADPPVERRIPAAEEPLDAPVRLRRHVLRQQHLLAAELLEPAVELAPVVDEENRLQSLAEATLGRGKSGHGLQAVDWWKEGKIDKVREYCIDDVRLTRELYDYALKHRSLKFKDLRDIREIKIDTSRWGEKAEAPAMTHALPL